MCLDEEWYDHYMLYRWLFNILKKEGSYAENHRWAVKIRFIFTNEGLIYQYLGIQFRMRAIILFKGHSYS